MEKNLFGENIKKRKTRLESALLKHDKESFEERLDRLKYLQTIFPNIDFMAGRPETILIFEEAKMTFINGEFISTVMLAQAFIEHVLQEILTVSGLYKESKHGLKSMIDSCRSKELLNDFFLQKIEKLRKIRNPFSHLKDFEHDHNLSQRMFSQVREQIEKEKKGAQFKEEDIHETLEQDAKDALSIMYTISICKCPLPPPMHPPNIKENI